LITAAIEVFNDDGIEAGVEQIAHGRRRSRNPLPAVPYQGRTDRTPLEELITDMIAAPTMRDQ